MRNRSKSDMKAIEFRSVLFIVACFGNYEINAAENKFALYGPPMEPDVERVIVPNTQLSVCLEMCGLRPWCKVAAFHSKAGICELYFDAINLDYAYCERENCQAMMYFNRDDFTGDGAMLCNKLCPKVDVLQKCDLKLKACLTDVCPPFSEQTNGKVLGNTHHEGHVRRLLCNRGYTPRDLNKVESRCTNGRWTDVTACVQDCPVFGGRLNGHVDGTSVKDGSVRKLTCNSGYTPSDMNAVESKCENGQWTSMAHCIRVCPPYPTPTNGDVMGASNIEDSTRELQCRFGYSPVDAGNTISTCTNGQWTAITQCLQVCPTYQSPTNGEVVGASNIEGSTRTLSCQFGYNPADASNMISTCMDGEWTTITQCLRDCVAYPSPENGAVSGTSTIGGSTRELICKSGYSPADANNVTSTCTNGQWTSITKCQKDCPAYPSPENGAVSGTSTIEGSTRELTCQSGSSPADASNVTSTCTNGQWTTITKCLKDCVAYPSPENGAVSGTSTIGGSTRELICKAGYSPADANNVTSTCTNGQWTSITKCQKDCPAYPSPENGAVSGTSTIEGSTRELTCRSGYTPADASNVTSTCTNGEWTAITKCLKVCEMYEGSIKTLDCNIYYAPLDRDNITSQCNDGQLTTVTRCLKDYCVRQSGKFKESVYLITDKDHRKFNDAVRVCSECGSKVVTMESEEEEQFVTTKFISSYESQTVGYWLGITKTEDGALHDLSYRNFGPGEPNGGINADCLGIYKAANWKWIDLKCDNDRDEYDMHVVCETVP